MPESDDATDGSPPIEALLRFPTAIAFFLAVVVFLVARSLGASVVGALIGATTIGLLISIRVDLSEMRVRLARLEPRRPRLTQETARALGLLCERCDRCRRSRNNHVPHRFPTVGVATRRQHRR
ncbi:hypothetical protein BH23ACT10_BH23ACT10_08800 [soil metagenome]